MMKSEKYKKHYRSKYEFATRVVRTGGTKGTLVVGSRPAKSDIERKLGRPLHKDTVERHTRFQWCFCEPKK